MVCQNCRKEIDQGSKFCFYCGTKTGSKVETVGSGFSRDKIVIVALVLSVAVTVGGIWWWQGRPDAIFLPKNDGQIVTKQEIPIETNKMPAVNIDKAAEVGEVTIIPPIESGPSQSEPAQVQEQDQGILLIKQYYQAITDGHLEKAYNMYGDKKVSFTEYQKWYGTAISATPSEFNKIGENRYQFNVSYSDREIGVALYRVVMEIENGKINPISSELIIN